VTADQNEWTFFRDHGKLDKNLNRTGPVFKLYWKSWYTISLQPCVSTSSSSFHDHHAVMVIVETFHVAGDARNSTYKKPISITFRQQQHYLIAVCERARLMAVATPRLPKNRWWNTLSFSFLALHVSASACLLLFNEFYVLFGDMDEPRNREKQRKRNTWSWK
jgi:hypothetical protein